MRSAGATMLPTGCDDCDRRSSSFFCAVSEIAFAHLKSIKTSYFYPRGSTILMEGQPARGVFLLCTGRVKLSTCSEDGKSIILRVSEAGEALGLSAVFASAAYEKTAQAIVDSTVSFIPKEDFLRFVRTHHEAALAALKQLSSNYHQAHMQVCSLGLSSSAADKLARLLLQWCESSGSNGGPVRIRWSYTHSDIAEMIGSSRETVTRLLGSFRDRGLIRFSRSELFVPDKKRLKTVIGTRYQNGNGHL